VSKKYFLNPLSKKNILKNIASQEEISKEKLNQLRSKITKFNSALKATENIKAKVWEIDYMSGYLNI
jgi:hypothetical protein